MQHPDGNDPHCYVCRRPIEIGERIVITQISKDVAVWRHYACISIEEAEEIEEEARHDG